MTSVASLAEAGPAAPSTPTIISLPPVSTEVKFDNSDTTYLTGNDIRTAVKALTEVCYRASKDAGWWTDHANDGEPLQLAPRIVQEKIALIHSEVSEALEGYRKGKDDDHLPHLKSLEVELADALIRIFDLAGAFNLRLGQAFAEKMIYNSTRPDHKIENRLAPGGKKF